jgi:NADPH:quinone reductase-like Zn-dependent oxidoreductase
VLRPNGRYVMIGGHKGNWVKPLDRAVALMAYSRFVDQEMRMMVARPGRDDLVLLAELMQQGRVRSVIDKT